MYLDAIGDTHADNAVLGAWADTNPGRLDFYESHRPEFDLQTVPRFAPANLSAAIRQHNIDSVIITTPDATHADFIVETLRAGADVVVEKPLTIDADGVHKIAVAATETGRDVIITFNYRYSPRNEALKQVIQDGTIGTVTSVHFEWLLDTSHGADYFRRWHRLKEVSGGLLIHKASHHFDLVNWWLDDHPTRVFATGGLRFYGADNAKSRGLGERPERGTTDSELADAFSLDLRRDEYYKGLYYDQEHHDGYRRDQDVFDEGITIEDNMSVVVDYAGGPSMSYTLSAHGPWEGYTVVMNGTKGRAELTVVERGAVLFDEDGHVTVDPSASPDGPDADANRPVSEQLIVQRHWEPAHEVAIPEALTAHGGGDEVLLREVFVGVEHDPLRRAAGWVDGARAVSVGIAGNESLLTGQAVLIQDLDLGVSLDVTNRAD